MRNPLKSVISALLLGLCACGSSNQVLRESKEYRERANFYLAYTTLDVAKKEHPGDEAIERAWWKARLEYLIDHGRELVFKERMTDALPELEAALALDPGNKQALFWSAKARLKLADLAVRSADEARITGRMDNALLLYNEALHHVPGYADAEVGIDKVRADFDRRQHKAQDHYIEGVRTQADQLYNQTTYHLGEALRNDPALDNAKDRKAAVDQRLVERRFTYARRLEDKQRYGAALLEYQAIALQVPDYPGIDERISMLKKEVEAEQLERLGEKALFREDFEAARGLLEQAYDMSTNQRKAIGEELVILKEREFNQRYAKAKDLELERKYEDAVRAYQELEKSWPAQKDVRTRISGLEAAIDVAKRAFARGDAAEKAGNTKTAIDAYQEALLFWPGYLGLDKHIRELKLKL